MRVSLKLFLVVLVLIAAPAQSQSNLQISPALITQCGLYGLGRATLTWTSPGPGQVQVRVHTPTGPTLTGPTVPVGSAETGDWVADGTVFVLIEAGTTRELARVTAQLSCAPFSRQVPAALAAGSYLPLQVGNQWLYRVNDRLTTSHYLEWRILRAELINGKGWFVLSGGYTEFADRSETRVRNDEQGRVLALNPQGQETVWLDPTTPDPSALYQIETRGPYQGPLGSFDDALNYSSRTSLSLERGAFIRGIGRATYSRTMLTGSSGGFTDGGDLVYARIAGKLIFATSAVSLELAAEKNVLPVSTGGVSNCALPCYFPACGLGSPVDPPGTYKPCFQARVRLQMPTSATINLELVNAADQAVFQTSLPVILNAEVPEAAVFRQIPLYSAPNQPFPPGVYRLRAFVRDDAGEVASGVVTVKIQ